MSNSDVDLPAFDDVADALVRCQIGIDAAELHGLLVGYLAAGETLPEQDWLSRLHVDADAAAVGADAQLSALRSTSISQLADPEMGFALLLPDDDVELLERIDALFAWCRGFQSGFSLSTNRPAMSEDAQEAFDDLGQIAGFSVDDDEQDEEALLEVTEFVRVAVMLIHGDVLISRQRQGRLH